MVGIIWLVLNKDIVAKGRQVETDGFVLEEELGEEGEVLAEQLAGEIY